MFLLIVVVLALACSPPGQAQLFEALDAPMPVEAAQPHAVGDLDGDGDADLIGRNGVFANDGHGRFKSAAAGASLAFSRTRATLAHLNADSLLDVVSVDASTGTIRVDLNLGNLSFTGPTPGLPAVPNAYDVAAGDVDSDGDVDLLVASLSPLGFTGASIWLNNGAATFTQAPFPSLILPTGRLFLRDLDLDGDPDAVFSGNMGTTGQLRTATNAGGAFTMAPTPIWSMLQTSADIGNFDGNGFPDIVLGTPSGTVVILGVASGFLPPVVTATPTSSRAILAIDVNADGLDEIVEEAGTAGALGGLTLFPVVAGYAIGAPLQIFPALFLPQAPGAELARDLDGDGDRDAIAWNVTGATALMNAGNGSLVALGARGSGSPLTSSQRSCDVDGDGDLDVVGLNGPSIAVGLNDGSGWYTAGTTVPFNPLGGPYAYSLNVFDSDGDGDPDIFAARNTSNAEGAILHDLVFTNVGGVFTQVAMVAGPGTTSAFRAADVDGDGDQDVILGRRDPMTNSLGLTGPMILLVNLGGTGLSAPVPFGVTNHATYDVEVGDFDGNGLTDVLQVNALPPGGIGTPDPCVLWLNGGGVFTEHVQAMSGYYSAAGDLNGDGRTDVVMDGQVWFGSAGGMLSPGPMLSPLVSSATLVDVDEDGDLDLVETGATVYFNNGGGNFALPVSYFTRVSVPPDFPNIGESSGFDADRDGDLDIVAPGPIVFSNTRRQIALGSIARPGRPASIDLYGQPGGSWLLWASNGLTSFSFPPWGLVQIDPLTAQLGASGTFAGPAAPLPGTATVSTLVPNNPGLVGWTTYWQAIDLAQLRFTNRIVITVLGY